MTRIHSRTPRILLAVAVCFGAVAAQAASGYTVTKDQEALAVPGMSSADVRQALGRPESNVKYINEPGRTFTYRVQSSEPTLFDVDFGADGRVASVGERMEEVGGHSGHR